jgi:putative transposase
VKFAFIRDHQEAFPVEALCDVLDVSRSGYYAWSRRPPCTSDLRRTELVERIREAHSEGRANYGSPRVFKALQKEGVACCENTVAKLMKAAGIRSKSKRSSRVRTTDSRHDHPVAANILNREFYPDRANEVWTADITYVPTAEGWLYLAVVLDLFSRRIIGWATADHLRAELSCDALEMALTHRQPKGELLHHSDRGAQYASGAYQKILAGHGIEPSMSRAGNCHDNAVTESFFSTLKGELTHHESYASREEARRSLFEYIEVFYNRKRLHSTLGYRSPADYEVRFSS